MQSTALLHFLYLWLIYSQMHLGNNSGCPQAVQSCKTNHLIGKLTSCVHPSWSDRFCNFTGILLWDENLNSPTLLLWFCTELAWFEVVPIFRITLRTKSVKINAAHYRVYIQSCPNSVLFSVLWQVMINVNIIACTQHSQVPSHSKDFLMLSPALFLQI